MTLSDLEQAIVLALAPLQSEGYRVHGSPVDHASVGRVFGKGEVRVAYQSRAHGSPTGIGRVRSQVITTNFEVVIELQDVRQKTHPHAAATVERVIELLDGIRPDGGTCGPALYPIKDGFVGRNEDTAVWVYSVQFGLNSIGQKRMAA